jgi:invasion protein IalB
MRHALFALLLAAPAVASAQTARAPSEVSARADSGATPKAWTVSAAVQQRIGPTQRLLETRVCAL